MNILKTIFNLLEAIVFKAMQFCFGVNFKWLKYSKIITGVLLAVVALILAVFVSKWFLAGFLALFGLGQSKVDEKQIQDDVQRQKEINDKNLNDTLYQSEQKTLQINDSVKQAEENTKLATANKSKGVTGRQLDEMARDEK